jgi:hypothetical protein
VGLLKKTQTKYWAIYEAYLKGASRQKIMLLFDCDRTTVWRAIKWCQLEQIKLSAPETLAALIDAKVLKINELHQRIDFLKQGWNEERISRKEDGTEIFTEVRGKFSPYAEVEMYRTIRDLENDIAELQGLYEYKTGHPYFEDTSEDVDFDAIAENLAQFEGESDDEGI